MSSFTYNGHDFGAYVSAELAEPPAHAVRATTAEAPGRPGLVLLSGDVAPLKLRLHLFMDVRAPGGRTPAEARRDLRAWLLAPAGATLAVPGEPGLEWRCALCAGVDTWSSLFSDGAAEVAFDCLDPIAYGEAREEAASTLDVGGTWPTWPTFEIVAAAGDGVSVTEGGRGVFVERALRAGDVVAIDCAAGRCSVNGADATASVALRSDLLRLAPGRHELAFSGCASHVARWRERWA
ncbi:MAG: phage tail family protein [Olsenella sp.]|nr:phage tail family protein [Olsenella sp.]